MGPMPSGRRQTVSPTPRRSARERTPRVAVVVSRYNDTVTGALQQGALAEYGSAGGDPASVEVIDAPGAFELSFLSYSAAASGRFDGVLAIGCIVKGETSHDRYLAEAVANGLTNASLLTGVPIAFGVLTVDTAEQALARAGGDKGNKGAEAMSALLATIAAAAGRSAPAPRPDKLAPRTRPGQKRKAGGAT